MVAMVLGALVLSGVGTYGLTALDSVHQTQTELVHEALDLAHGIEQEVTPGRHHGSLGLLRSTVKVLKGPLELQGEALLAVTHDGTLYNLLSPGSPVALPSGLTASDLDMEQLLFGQPVSGEKGRLAWAAFLFSLSVPVLSGPGQASSVTLVVVLTREAPAGPPGLLAWGALASAFTLVVALAASYALGRRIARPLQRTETVTRSIAAGDLTARVEVQGSDGTELVSLANSVNQMADALTRAQGSQRQFLMSVSHDLRTPLTSIKGFAEAMADGATDDVGHAAAVITSEAHRLERLVGDLLELAKLEAGAFSLHLGHVDLARVVTEAVQAFEPAAANIGINLRLGALEEPGPLCWADPDRLGQVVANLVENALKYAASEVVVEVGGIAGGPLVYVQDDGPGIPEQDRRRVFERLYQSRPTPGRNLGSGLGLAIVEELVTAMGGQVRAEPAEGAGTAGTRVVVDLLPGDGQKQGPVLFQAPPS